MKPVRSRGGKVVDLDVLLDCQYANGIEAAGTADLFCLECAEEAGLIDDDFNSNNWLFEGDRLDV